MSKEWADFNPLTLRDREFKLGGFQYTSVCYNVMWQMKDERGRLLRVQLLFWVHDSNVEIWLFPFCT